MKFQPRLKLLVASTLVVTSLLGSSLPLTRTVFAADAPLPIGNTLQDFYDAAIEWNPTVSIAYERWMISGARKDAATGQLLPQISATATITENERDANNATLRYRGERFGVQLNQVLFNWQAFAARSRAALQEDASEAEYYANLAALLTEVADKYLTVLQAEDAIRSIDSELEAMSNQLNQIQSLYDRQLARITDLYDAQARLAATRALRVEAEGDLLLSRAALRGITNLETGELSWLPDDVELPPLEGSLEDWIERTRSNNWLIAARTLSLEAADKQVSEQRGAYLPRVSLIAQKLESNTGFDNQFLDTYETAFVGVDVQVPLYAGGSRRAGVREAVSLRSIAESELRQTQLDMLEGSRTAYLQARTGESRIAAARSLAESTDTAYTAMQRGFELGTVTSVDMLNALRDRFQAQRELQSVRYDYIRALLLLQREAGSLGPEDLTRNSDLLESR